MIPESKLLDQARAAGTRLADAERAVLVARADYHAAIRRLHLAGASLREIAQALSLSHQRVQQVVQAAGGSWWQVWRRRGAARDLICTWCERPAGEVAQLIAGPKVYICDACVASNERAVRERASAEPAGARRHARGGCDFCGKRETAQRSIARGRAAVCSDCLRVCREILESGDVRRDS